MYHALGKQPPRGKKLRDAWNRRCRSSIAGANVFGDRLVACGKWESDKCTNPLCNGARADAEHWHYSCHSNPCKSSRADIEVYLDSKSRESALYGPARERLLRDQFKHPCLRLCGIWGETLDKRVSKFAYDRCEQDDLIGLRAILDNGARTLPPGSKVYTDGSAYFSGNEDVAFAGWGVAVWLSSDSDTGSQGVWEEAFGPVKGTIQNSYRAELRAAVQALCGYKGADVMLYIDCQSVVRQIGDFCETGRRADDPPAQEWWDLLYDAVTRNYNGKIRVVWLPSHTQDGITQTGGGR